MQETYVPPHWIQTALGWLASGVAGGLIVRLWTTWLNRKKPAAEIHVTEATAGEIKVRASSSASDAVMRMMEHLGRAQETIDRLRAERDAWQDEHDKIFVERDEMLRRNGLLKEEVKNYENQIRTMSATLTIEHKNYDNTQDTKPENYTLPAKPE
jgi:hypothetical protein